jgi:hypothetical protein
LRGSESSHPGGAPSDADPPKRRLNVEDATGGSWQSQAKALRRCQEDADAMRRQLQHEKLTRHLATLGLAPRGY